MSDEPNEATQEAMAHLRAAALEMIGAARAVLDLTERLVEDPAPLVQAVAALAAAARPVPAGPVGVDGDGGADDAPGSDGSTRPGPRPRPRVQHIRVS